MLSAQFCEFGAPTSVLKVGDSPLPKIASPDEIIVNVKAASINPVDFKIMLGYLKYAQKTVFPATPGVDFSGVITEVGTSVTNYQVGDEVYGRVSNFRNGTLAEYVLISTTKDAIKLKPPNVTHVQASSVATCAMTAVAALYNHAKLNQDGGKKLLVIGASGGVGSFLVPAAKHLGAIVTAVCSGKNASFVQHTLKADNVIDYTKAPLSEQFVNSEFDVIIDCVGGDEYWKLAQTILKPTGIFVTLVGPTPHGGEVNLGAVGSVIGSKLWRMMTNTRKYEILMTLQLDLFDVVHTWISGGILEPQVGHVFPLSNVKDAFELLESHRAVGKIVVNISK